MRAYTLIKEDVVSIPLEEINRRMVTWVRCVNPVEEDLKALSDLSEIPIEEFRESIEEDQRPKLNITKYVEIIYRAPYRMRNEVITIPVSFFQISNLIITIEKTPLPILEELEEMILKKRARFLFRKTPGFFFYYVFDKINDDFLSHIDRVTDSVETVKKKEEQIGEIAFERLYSLSVTSSFFNQALIANIEVLNALRKAYYKHFTTTNKRAFEELYYDALQILDREKIQREVITNLFNLQNIRITMRLNEFIKKLTALALVVMVPTLISGIYGMNVRLPLEDSPYAFWIIIFTMVMITILMLWIFKEWEWF